MYNTAFIVVHTGTVRRYLHDAARPWALIRVDNWQGAETTHCLGRWSTCKAACAAQRSAVRYEQDETGH
jgi:hypothetical protein